MKLYTYTTHTTHARAHIRHTWTEIATEIQRGTSKIPTNATPLGKYTYFHVHSDGLTMEIWHKNLRNY